MKECISANKMNKMAITRNVILVALLLAPFFRPNGINWILPGGQYVYDLLSMVSLLILLAVYLAGKRQTIDFQWIVFGFMLVVIMLSTLIHGGDKMVHLRVAVTCIGMMIAISCFRHRPTVLMSALLLDTELLVYINALCLIMFPGGMYLSHVTYGASNNWFMGYDNHWFVFYYAAYYLAVVNILYGGDRWRSCLLIATIHITSLYVFSGVLVVGLFLMDVMFIFKVYHWKLFDFKTVLTGGLLLTVVLIFFQTNETVQYVITNVLGKEDSMSARTRIWRGAISKILQSPIWGNGRLFVEEAQTFYGLPAAVNAHNMWLEVLVEGGILALSAFLIIMILVMIRNDKKQSLFYKILLIPIAVCLVVMSVDSMIETRGVMFFAFLAIGYHCPYYASAVDPLVLSRFEDGSVRLSPALWIAKIRRARIRSKLLR